MIGSEVTKEGRKSYIHEFKLNLSDEKKEGPDAENAFTEEPYPFERCQKDQYSGDYKKMDLATREILVIGNFKSG